MSELSYQLHHNEKYENSRKKIYKNRYGIHTPYQCIDGTIYSCRSKLEYSICSILESLNIMFEYENIEIDYFREDGSKHKYLPDFYLPNYNLIIEGKMSNEQELDMVVRKREATINAGYKFLFIDEIDIKDPNIILQKIALCVE